MVKQKLLEFKKLERTDDKVTPRAGPSVFNAQAELILFDGFMKAMKIDKIVNDNKYEDLTPFITFIQELPKLCRPAFLLHLRP